MSFVTRMMLGASLLRLLSLLKERTLSLSLSLSLSYIYTCGLSSFLKNVFILFLDLKKECALTKHRPLFSFSLSLRLFISLFESCLRDNNRDD